MYLGEIPSAQSTLFEYFFDSKKLLWVPWVDVIPEYVHDPEKKFSEILVPTVDTVRTTWLLELMVSIKRPVVLVGETGTSKSATTANFLRSLDKDSTVCYQELTVFAASMKIVFVRIEALELKNSCQPYSSYVKRFIVHL